MLYKERLDGVMWVWFGFIKDFGRMQQYRKVFFQEPDLAW